MEFLSKSGLSFFKSLLDLYFATKSYVNKAISTNTGKFWGTFNDLSDLQEITGSNGDYAYVIVPDDYSTSYDRYKWQDGQWVYEYTVGGEAFDDDQWAAINSGMTSADKTRLNEISDNIGNNSISEMRSDIDANASEIEEINEELGDIDAVLATKANVDGYYESMAVGQADNLKGQVLIPNDAAFRTSGGSEDVDSGIAHLQDVKGNTVSWNQLMKNPTMQNSHSDWYCGWNIVSETDSAITLNRVSGAVGFHTRAMSIIGHKYYISLRMKIDDDGGSDTPRFGTVFYAGRGVFGNFTLGQFGIVRKITQANDASYIGFSFYPNINIRVTIDKTFGVNVFDLTLIYGAGNEPTSVEQFEADYEKWFGKPLTYEPYNAGELIPAKTTALKTTGFNQLNNGVAKVIGGNAYQITGTYTSMTLDGETVTPDSSGIFTPDHTGELTVVGYSTDTCVHLVWSGTRNGEYEPYKEHTLQLPITTLTGKLNGAGESVVVFPDGMKKAGSAQDEIYISGGKTYAVKRVGSVNLGQLTWNRLKPSGRTNYHFRTRISTLRSSYPYIGLCPNYTISPTQYGELDGTYNYAPYSTLNDVNIIDNRYTDAATFKAAMQGVMLYYELATPLVYELDNFKLPATFKVNDFGTEEQVHADGVASVPAILNSLYAVNAVDTIRRLPQNHISQESMDNFLAQLGAAMGGTWTKSFNTTTNEWEFSFVQSASLMSVSNNEETSNEES